MAFFRRKVKKHTIERKTALACRPVKLPIVRREELPEGKARITVMLGAPKLVRLLGGKNEVERTFGLDTLGREVYAMCAGESDVEAIIARFGRAHRLSLAEAELSVTTFMKTLMARGLVAVSG